MKKLLWITALAASATLSLNTQATTYPFELSNDGFGSSDNEHKMKKFWEESEHKSDYDFPSVKKKKGYASPDWNHFGDFDFFGDDFNPDIPIVIDTTLGDLFELFLTIIEKKIDFFPPHHGHHPHGKWKYCDTPVNPVPVPAAAWLFGSALLSVVGIKRRRGVSH